MSLNESFFNLAAPLSTERDASSEITFITIVLAIVYVMSSYILGYIWIKKKIFEMDAEINNRMNPFVKEMREKFK